MKTLLKTPLGQFRLVSLAEGISYILLMFLAMPLKYIAGEPTLVRIFGSIHGGLFFLFMFTLVHAAFNRGWKLPRVMIAFVASIIPFGAFFLERSLKEEMEAILVPIPVRKD